MIKHSLTQTRSGQILAALLCIMLVFGFMLPSVVHADSTIDQTTSGTLTINKVKSDGETSLEGAGFTLYKIMNLTPGAKAGDYASYSKVAHYNSKLANLTPDALGNYSATQIENLVNSLLPLTETDTDGIAMPDTNASGQSVKSGIPLGYYLVVETKVPDKHVAGKPFFIAIPSTDNYNDKTATGSNWTYKISVTPKNTSVDLTKKIIDSKGDLVSKDSATVGSTVKYVVDATVPNFSEFYFEGDKSPVFKLTDRMSAGLTLNTAATSKKVVIVSGTTENPVDASGNYTWTDNPSGSNGFDLTFTKAFLEANKGKAIKVYYEAVLNNNAVISGSGNDNKVVLNYGNSTSTTESIESGTVVYTFGIGIEKFANNALLAGAEFELYSDPECKTKVFSNAITSIDTGTGIVKFPGVKEGTYYLKETTAPAGYKLLSNTVKVDITATKDSGVMDGTFTVKIDEKDVNGTAQFYSRMLASEGTAVISVENHKGFNLPETGGMGIMIFLAVGLIGIIAISLVMMRNKKKSNAKA